MTTMITSQNPMVVHMGGGKSDRMIVKGPEEVTETEDFVVLTAIWVSQYAVL